MTPVHIEQGFFMSDIRNRRVVRINRFSVPASARNDFMALVAKTHDVIRTLPGFMNDMILEQRSGPSAFNLVTILQFEGEDALQPAITAVARADAQAGIDRQALNREWGVETEIAFYHPTMPETDVEAATDVDYMRLAAAS